MLFITVTDYIEPPNKITLLLFVIFKCDEVLLRNKTI